MASAAPRYAHAFSQVTEAAGLDATAVRQQLSDFAETLVGSGELRELLMNPSIEIQQKINVLDAMAGRMGMSSQVRNFIAVILDHHRLAELDEILAAYAEIVDEHSGAAEATITTAHPLNADDRASLEAQVAKLAGARVRASYVEDATLLGGAVVQIGSTVYDGSVRAQLEQLKHRLVNA
jgi:F-type H+-transporting ATPase subunit delta